MQLMWKYWWKTNEADIGRSGSMASIYSTIKVFLLSIVALIHAVFLLNHRFKIQGNDPKHTYITHYTLHLHLLTLVEKTIYHRFL